MDLRLKDNKKSISKIGDRNPMWKGNHVGYTALHNWIKRRFPKPELCSNCNSRKAIDLANISQEYKRDVFDWEWLCRKCHMEKDDRIVHFLSHRKSLEKGNKIWKLKKTLHKGEDVKTSKLREVDVIDIRKKYSTGKFTLDEIAKEYGICFQNVSSIINRISWKHI